MTWVQLTPKKLVGVQIVATAQQKAQEKSCAFLLFPVRDASFGCEGVVDIND